MRRKDKQVSWDLEHLNMLPCFTTNFLCNTGKLLILSLPQFSVRITGLQLCFPCSSGYGEDKKCINTVPAVSGKFNNLLLASLAIAEVGSGEDRWVVCHS